jgi:hypothetical protein
MKRSVWNKKSEPIAAALPGFRRFKGGFVRESEWVFQAFLADSSSFDANRITIEAFVLPRFVPTDHLHFGYGFRVRDFWNEIGPETVAEIVAARPALERLASFDGLREGSRRWRTDKNRAELRLCLSILERNAADFTAVSRHLASADADGIAWKEHVLGRCRDLAQVVNNGGWGAGESVRSRREGVDRLFA